MLPEAALAAVIVCAVLHMVDIDIVIKLWKTSRLDLIPLVGTFVCGLLLGVEVGLGCGVAIDALLILFYQVFQVITQFDLKVVFILQVQSPFVANWRLFHLNIHNIYHYNQYFQ
ncbi:unnamed protein product [Leptidea sinapis]|uniref:SLC26A/SulP transporter domain-containing protein n=1 Tax=Leptidea sinapis TaxID=189913 RepID=A0A5E4PP83_9NEOP|nr:unnamed protein product [Leptidea sinapis]